MHHLSEKVAILSKGLTLYSLCEGGRKLCDKKKIVEYLYAKKQAIAPKALAAEFQISERTLANDIKWLRDIGRTEGFSIERIRSAGYQLEISDKTKFLRFLSHAKRQEKDR